MLTLTHVIVQSNDTQALDAVTLHSIWEIIWSGIQAGWKHLSSWVKGLILLSPYMSTLLKIILLLFILKIRHLARKRYKTHKNVVLLAEALESKTKGNCERSSSLAGTGAPHSVS